MWRNPTTFRFFKASAFINDVVHCRRVAENQKSERIIRDSFEDMRDLFSLGHPVVNFAAEREYILNVRDVGLCAGLKSAREFFLCSATAPNGLAEQINEFLFAHVPTRDLLLVVAEPNFRRALKVK